MPIYHELSKIFLRFNLMPNREGRLDCLPKKLTLLIDLNGGKKILKILPVLLISRISGVRAFQRASVFVRRSLSKHHSLNGCVILVFCVFTKHSVGWGTI